MAALLLPALVLLLLAGLALSSPPALGGPTPGKACKPVGRTVVVGEWTYTCVKKKKGKSPVWVRTPTPAPTPTPTPTPKPGHRNRLQVGGVDPGHRVLRHASGRLESHVS